MTSCELVKAGSEQWQSQVTKPKPLKTKVLWPLKKVMRSLPFKVFLLSLGIGSYWADVGTDADSAVQWFTMRDCFRYYSLYSITEPAF